MIVDESIVYLPIKPAVKGIYYTLASKADRQGNVILPVRKFNANAITVIKYIKDLERMDLLEKNQMIVKDNNLIKKINKYKLKITKPEKIPFEVYKKVETLSLTDKGIFLSLYLMSSDEGYIYSSVKELSQYFACVYATLITHINKLQEVDLLEKERGIIKLNVK